VTELLVQVIPDESGNLAGSSLREKFADRAEELGSSVGQIANELWARLDAELHASPESDWNLKTVELKFSLDLEAETGVVLARAKATAGFEVSLSWQRGAAEAT
jgi:hypothetical protein